MDNLNKNEVNKTTKNIYLFITNNNDMSEYEAESLKQALLLHERHYPTSVSTELLSRAMSVLTNSESLTLYNALTNYSSVTRVITNYTTLYPQIWGK